MNLHRFASSCRAALPLTAALVVSGAASGCYAGGPVAWQDDGLRAMTIDPRPGCTLWHGGISGNARGVSADVELCPLDDAGDRVFGRVQLRSDETGHSVRRVEGAFDPSGALVLHDVGFDVDDPSFLWVFCRIDRYELRPVGDVRLVGRYASKACSDHARVDLTRVR